MGPGPSPSPLDWARQRLAGRARRKSAAVVRAEHQLEGVGPAWRVIELPDETQADGDASSDSFVAIGPGGVFSVIAVDHGRKRVMLAGDVIQIQGRRPPYVTQARRTAKRVSAALSDAVGTRVPVVPVLAFVGSGALSFQGQPEGCVAIAHKELDRVLLAAGSKISAGTAQKLAEVASHPATWIDRTRGPVAARTTSDSRAARR